MILARRAAVAALAALAHAAPPRRRCRPSTRCGAHRPSDTAAARPPRRSRSSACAPTPPCGAASGSRWPTSRRRCARPWCSAKTSASTSTAASTGAPVGARAWGNLWNTRTRGASTITMQLAGLLDDDLARGAGGRSVAQKIGQTVAAQVLERRWRKDQILEAYLNLVPFRGEIVGIDALSRTLFGKARARARRARGGGRRGAGARARTRARRTVAQRACGVLRPCRRPRSAPACDGLDLFAQAPGAAAAGTPLRRRLAPHSGAPACAPRPRGRRRPAQPQSTRSRAAAALRRRRRCAHSCANCAAATWRTARSWCSTTPAARCWPGSARRGELSRRRRGRRRDGAAPARLHAQAVPLRAGHRERRLITAASLLDDSSAQIATAGGLYIPQNYDRQFKGRVSVRTALGARSTCRRCARW